MEDETASAPEPQDMVDVYVNGVWTKEPDPIDWPENASIDRTIRANGWSELTEVGSERQLAIGGIVVWRRRAHPRFLINYSDPTLGGEIVYAATFPDVMDLLAKWAPAVQAQAVVTFVTELLGPDDAYLTSDVAAQLASRLAYGASRASDWEREAREERHQRSNRRPSN